MSGDGCVFKKGFDQRAHFSELAHDTDDKFSDFTDLPSTLARFTSDIS